jgi:hypothetical protein
MAGHTMYASTFLNAVQTDYAEFRRETLETRRTCVRVQSDDRCMSVNCCIASWRRQSIALAPPAQQA